MADLWLFHKGSSGVTGSGATPAVSVNVQSAGVAPANVVGQRLIMLVFRRRAAGLQASCELWTSLRLGPRSADALKKAAAPQSTIWKRW